ncbi:MAG: signal peptidase II [Leptospirales bacterium]
MAKKSWVIYALVAVSVFIIDQVTKFLVMSRVPVGSWVDVIPHFFRVISIRNTGIVFGLFSQGPARTTQTVFIVFTIAAMVIILLYSHRKRSVRTPEFYVLALILGGALGNLLDRILHGRVVDFLDFYVRGYHWYTFNIADTGIVTGVFLLLIIQWIEGRKQNRTEQ